MAPSIRYGLKSSRTGFVLPGGPKIRLPAWSGAVALATRMGAFACVERKSRPGRRKEKPAMSAKDKYENSNVEIDASPPTDFLQALSPRC